MGMNDTPIARERYSNRDTLPDAQGLPVDQLQRLFQLMEAHSEGTLSASKLQELESLVAMADDLDFANTQRLVELHARQAVDNPSRENSGIG